MKRLNVGSGKDYREGYINLEPHPQFKSDMEMDIRDAVFEPNELDEILAQDVIDHVTYFECLDLLQKFYIWLKNNGVLNIHLPNFDNISVWAKDGNHEAMVWIYGTDGKRAYYETNFIKWSYSPKSLRKILEKIGFVIVKEEDDCNGYAFRMLAVKR